MAVKRSVDLPGRTLLARRPISKRAEPFRSVHSHFWCDTEDGVRLAGSVLGDAQTDVALVLAHGFMGYRSKPKARLLADALATRHRVFAFDLRGHGQSGGACTGGAVEQLDVDAVVKHARRRGFARVVTIGWSLGGIAVIRHAATLEPPDGVVAISAPARWKSESKAVRRTSWLFTNRVGRALARELLGTRIDLRSDMPEPPGAIVGKIAPAPILIVHGADDHFFGPSAAQELYEAAGEPKRLLMFERFGHAEDGFTSAFAARLSAEIDALLSGA
ncbi:MAG: alpha/beta hydrolase [Actinomycetota bacterium]